MPRTSAFKRALRRLIGLPHERGVYTRHPEFNPRKARGRLERDPATGQTRYVPEDGIADAFADLERGDVRSHDTLPRTGIDAPLSLLEEKVARISAAGEGDETELSVSLAEDVWHLLTVDLPVSRLLLLEVALEACVIVIFAATLCAVDIAERSTEGGGEKPTELLREKLLLSLTAVRLSTDSIFGWAARAPSSGTEIFVLAALGWCHWLLLSVAGAVIVARALKPLRQVVFSPDCVLTENELVVRMHVIRHRSVTLYNPHLTLVLVAGGGRQFNLPLPNDVTNVARWTSALPLNIRHVIDENSPLHASRGLVDTIMHVRVAVSATDGVGLPVNASMVYYSPRDKFYGGQPAFREAFAKRGFIFPRVLRGHAFQDQIRMFRNLEQPDASMETPTKLPLLAINFDTMGRAEEKSGDA
jgi:hypothetical protein